jgi:hypothetical protein
MADNLGEDKIDCQNLRSSRSRPSPAVSSAAEEDMMIVVVVMVVKVVKQFEFGRQSKTEF